MTTLKSPELLVYLECSCGATFEPEQIVTDRCGERYAVCPRCKNKIRLSVEDT
jgi:DNA-directed RNA polymerase subunit RPC12/RpoP